MKRFLISPWREYAIAVLVFVALLGHIFTHQTGPALLIVSIIGFLPTLWRSLKDIFKLKITIDVFNALAVIVAFVTDEIPSAAVIILMLTFAAVLDWYTETRTHNAVEELLKLKPTKAFIEDHGEVREVSTESIKVGDVFVVESGARVPVDGVVISGEASLNESSVTGESAFVAKGVGDAVLSLTLNESGAIKARATRVGKDSTSERMAELMRDAATRKSNPEKIADKFARIFLPAVAIMGVVTYFVTHDVKMVAAIFLVACADDIAVAIPLAMTAAFGGAAQRGIIIKDGKALDALSKVKTLVFDKTGTLTYGDLHVMDAMQASGVDQTLFWQLIAAGEKFSEHPLGRAVFHEALSHASTAPDPEDFKIYKGSGTWAKLGGNEIALGNENLMRDLGIAISSEVTTEIEKKRTEPNVTVVIVSINKAFAGLISISDVPRAEAKESIRRLRALGVLKVFMFTGDNQEAAEHVAKRLEIDEVRAAMLPEQKLVELEKLAAEGTVAMVGDGINDAPALSRADVAVAMGKGGTAVAVEAADIVILTDNLTRLPEAMTLARKTMSVIHVDMVIWLVSNIVGFALVFTGVAGPALAASYNFITDFFPLLNSTRLFRTIRRK